MCSLLFLHYFPYSLYSDDHEINAPMLVSKTIFYLLINIIEESDLKAEYRANEVINVLLTVPVTWNHRTLALYKRIVTDAFTIVFQSPVLEIELVTEPAAAAVYVEKVLRNQEDIDEDGERVILVLDFGGTTVDATLTRCYTDEEGETCTQILLYDGISVGAGGFAITNCMKELLLLKIGQLRQSTEGTDRYAETFKINVSDAYADEGEEFTLTVHPSGAKRVLVSKTDIKQHCRDPIQLVSDMIRRILENPNTPKDLVLKVAYVGNSLFTPMIQDITDLINDVRGVGDTSFITLTNAVLSGAKLISKHNGHNLLKDVCSTNLYLGVIRAALEQENLEGKISYNINGAVFIEEAKKLAIPINTPLPTEFIALGIFAPPTPESKKVTIK